MQKQITDELVNIFANNNLVLRDFVLRNIRRGHQAIGRRGISQFIERLARPHVVPPDIEASYREMAADDSREQEAQEWSESLIGDAFPSEPHASR